MDFFKHGPEDVIALCEEVERLRAAVLAEREACAKLADAHVGTGSHATADAAAAIRARK